MRVTRLFLFCALIATSLAAQDRLAEGIRQFDKGDYAAAEQTLQGLPGPHAKAFLALTMAATGRCDAAQPTLIAAFSAERDARIRKLTGLALARCAIAAQRFEEAASPLYQLQREMPDDADVLYETARLHLKAWNGAVERMFERAPDSFRVHQLSAEIFEIQRRYDEAVSEYRQAIAQSPQTPNLHYRLGRALLLRSHDPDALAEARTEFEAELKLNPNDPVAEYQVAQILEVQQQPDEAVKRLERAIELDPKFPEALIALGRHRMRGEDYAAAIKLFEQAIKLQPQSEPAHYALMTAYRNAGRRDDALRIKKKLDELQKAPAGEFSDFLERIGEKKPEAGEQPQP